MHGTADQTQPSHIKHGPERLTGATTLSLDPPVGLGRLGRLGVIGVLKWWARPCHWGGSTSHLNRQYSGLTSLKRSGVASNPPGSRLSERKLRFMRLAPDHEREDISALVRKPIGGLA